MKVITSTKSYFSKSDIKIFVDGDLIKRTRGKTVTEIPLSEGEHEIYFKLSTLKSKKIRVTNEDQITIDTNKIGAFWTFTQMVALILLVVGLFGGYFGIPEIISAIFCGIYLIGSIVWLVAFFTTVAPNALKVTKEKE